MCVCEGEREQVEIDFDFVLLWVLMQDVLLFMTFALVKIVIFRVVRTTKKFL